MHDMGLGGPYEVERDPEAKHAGSCFDGVYGCHKCWNAENDGAGTIGQCEWCKANEVPTRVVRAIDEPVMYAVCATCEDKQAAAAAAEYERLQDEREDAGCFDDSDDDLSEAKGARW